MTVRYVDPTVTNVFFYTLFFRDQFKIKNFKNVFFEKLENEIFLKKNYFVSEKECTKKILVVIKFAMQRPQKKKIFFF